MAEKPDTDKKPTETMPPPPAMQENEAQRTSRATADAMAQAQEREATETKPGGRYMVNGQMVDAEGKPVKD